MKRRDLIKKIESLGAEFVRHGGNHDWYQSPATGRQQPVPRHQEINEYTACGIIKAFSKAPEF